MLGAIIGDLAGSIYEHDQFMSQQLKPVEIKNIIEENAFYSDDTILTVAIADAILNKVDYEKKLKEYTLRFSNYKPNFTPYFSAPFSPNFLKWAHENHQGKSNGNGAMMRISPVGYLFNSEEDVVKNSYLATIPSHNTEEAIECATTVALIIFYTRKGLSKDEIIKKMNIQVRPPIIKKFNYTCKETIDLCLYSLFNANNFDESIRLAISFGGDTDTNACIVGSMAEAMFGIDSKLRVKALAKIPTEFKTIIERCYVGLFKKENEKFI